MKKTIVTVLLATTFLGACSVTPDYQRPGVDTPAQFSGQAADQETIINADWWKNFQSTELNKLMEQALVQNNDIRAGVHRVEQSRANLKIAGADLLPTVGASANAGRTFERNPSSARTGVSVGADVAYELDLFGRNAASVDSARANLAASQYAQDALNLVVMGDVAKMYFTLLNLRERLAIADDNLKNAREVSRIIQARYDAGAADALDLSQQKSVVASREAARASLVNAVTNAENALAVLEGQAPQTLKIESQKLAPLNVPYIVAGQPSSLLERRPDIRAAEADLVAANANIGVARAALFPSVTLGTNWGLTAAGFGDPATTALALAASLSAPIFNGGRLQGGVEATTARQAELAEIYRKTVLISFQEVEDALAGLKAAHARQVSLNTALEQSRKAYDLSRQQYDAGAIDFQRLLDTQDALLSAQDSYAQTKLEALSAAVDLYKSLGGGWNG